MPQTPTPLPSPPRHQGVHARLRRAMGEGTHLCAPLVNLKQPRRAHAAADAHRDDRMLGAATLAFDQDMPGHARAAHAERVTDRDRAAVDIELVHRNAETIATIEHLA